MPAFALTRVRLEQTIICSYLIYEEEAIGLRRFVSYIPIRKHKTAQAAMGDPSIAKHLSNIDLTATKIEAVKAQQEFTPSFLLANDKFERNWTKLDLCSMAKKRDLLVSSSASIFKHSLEREYITIYKEACAVVHADCSSLSYSYLDLYPSPDGGLVLMPVPSWALIVSATTAHYDILQCYEILEWLSIPSGPEYELLMDKWITARDKHVK